MKAVAYITPLQTKVIAITDVCLWSNFSDV